jgi:hypothetical protein
LKLTIEGKKKIAQEMAGKNAKKIDFDIHKEVYSKVLKPE